MRVCSGIRASVRRILSVSGRIEPTRVALPERLVQLAHIAHKAGLGRRCRQQGFHLGAVLGRQLAVDIGVQLGLVDATLGGHFTLLSAACPFSYSISVRSRPRPRASRDITVPTGMASTSAVSA